jgi:hypothetical protein
VGGVFEFAAKPVPGLRPVALAPAITPADSLAVAQAPHVAPRVCVETKALDLKAMTALRQALSQAQRSSN